MASTSLTIVLSEPLAAYVDSICESGSFATPSEFIRELIRDDRDRRRMRLEERLVLATEDEAITVSDEEWQSSDLIEVLRSKLASAQ